MSSSGLNARPARQILLVFKTESFRSPLLIYLFIYLFILFLWVWGAETHYCSQSQPRICCVVPAGFKLRIPLSPEFWDHMHVLPCPAHSYFFFKGVLCGKNLS